MISGEGGGAGKAAGRGRRRGGEGGRAGGGRQRGGEGRRGMTVLVTGGPGGLGPAVLRRLLTDGWRVVATVRDPGADLPEGVHGVIADVTEPAGAAAAVAVATAEPQRPLRAVVNLVGGYA